MLLINDTFDPQDPREIVGLCLCESEMNDDSYPISRGSVRGLLLPRRGYMNPVGVFTLFVSPFVFM